MFARYRAAGKTHSVSYKPNRSGAGEAQSGQEVCDPSLRGFRQECSAGPSGQGNAGGIGGRNSPINPDQKSNGIEIGSAAHHGIDTVCIAPGARTGREGGWLAEKKGMAMKAEEGGDQELSEFIGLFFLDLRLTLT